MSSDLPIYITVNEASLYILQDRVNELIALGYRPMGSVFLIPYGKDTFRYGQVMIKENGNEAKK